MMFNPKNVSVHFPSLMYTIANVLHAILQTFGIQKLVNVNGVLRLLFIKNKAADVFAHQILLSYFRTTAYHAMRLNIGTTKLKNANTARILSCTIV